MAKKHFLIQSFTKHDLLLLACEAAKEILNCDVDLIVRDDGDIVLVCDCNFDEEKAEDIFVCTSIAKIEFLDGYCVRDQAIAIADEIDNAIRQSKERIGGVKL